VKFVAYSVLINETPHGRIIPTRGIRQGDPLSSYLFLLCAEGLSSLLRKVEHDGHIIGIPTFARGFRLSHLIFADDSLLFCRANFMEWRKILHLLNQYEKASGQKLNNHKTSIFYSCNTREEFKEFISSSARIPATANYDKYLGLHALVGRSNTHTFTVIKG
jgi:hypothetical protein